ncbi:MAG: hypothetical protein HWN81_04535 [Candidatus Lokiarchaeota archaeon]|nr:hypothetical protein [Candidatus Lokiarchaeota archaeon]
MKLYKCSGCGKVIETLPKCCSEDMVFNEEENQFECYMGPNCGYLPLDDLKCEECCKN